MGQDVPSERPGWLIERNIAVVKMPKEIEACFECMNYANCVPWNLGVGSDRLVAVPVPENQVWIPHNRATVCGPNCHCLKAPAVICLH